MDCRITLKALACLLISTASVFAQDAFLDASKAKDCFNSGKSRDCWLQVGKLCADKIKSKRVCFKKAKVHDLCAKTARIKNACAERIRANEACVRQLRAQQAWIDQLQTNTICAQTANLSTVCTSSIQAQNICVNGNVEHCTCFKGIAGLDPEYTYTLGDPIVFNTIIDDPCHHFVQTATEGTVFVAPISGYYIVELETVFKDLAGPNVISGIPVVENTIVVNGLPRREGRYSFLGFSNDQVNDTTALVRLQAGDKVGGLMNVLVLDPVSGQIRYPGTVTLDGAPITTDSLGGTLLSIHYLSSDCPVICNPCVPPTTPCAPVVVDCPRIDVDCGSCEASCDDCEPCVQ